jgi:hypothetical protein
VHESSSGTNPTSRHVRFCRRFRGITGKTVLALAQAPFEWMAPN